MGKSSQDVRLFINHKQPTHRILIVIETISKEKSNTHHGTNRIITISQPHHTIIQYFLK